MPATLFYRRHSQPLSLALSALLVAASTMLFASAVQAQERGGGFYPVPVSIDAAHPAANAAAPVTAQRQLVQDFEADVFPPAGWTRFEFRGSDTQRWVLANEGGNRFAYSRNSDLGSGVVEDWFVTPLVSVTASEQTLSFDMAQQYPADLGSTYAVAVSTSSADQPSDFVELASWTESAGPEGQPAPSLVASGLTTYTLDLAEYVGQEVYIAFVHENDFGDSFILDNVSAPSAFAAATAPGCITSFSPADGATTVSAENLVLSWDPPAGEPASGYRIDIGTDPGATNIASDFDVGNNTSIEIENGRPGTTYFYRVEPYNGAGPALGCPTVAFTTQGPTAAFPYTEDFDDSASCALPAGWNLQRNSVTNEPWIFKKTMDFGAAADHTSGSGCFAAVDDSVPDEAPTSLLSPFFDFSTLTVPSLSFWFQNRRRGSQAPSGLSSLYIDVSTDGGSTYTESVGAFTSRYQRWTKVFVDLSAYAGAPDVRLRFRGVEASPGGSLVRSDLSVDDVFVGESPFGAAFSVSPGSGGAYSFGEVAPCAGRERVFTVANDGTRRSTLNLRALRLVGDAAFSVVDVTPTLPVILGENDAAALRLQFNPTTEGAKSATLELDYTVDAGALQTFSIALDGTGDALGLSSGEGAGYAWKNSSLCSASSLGFDEIPYGTAAGDTQITAWDTGGPNDGFFALDLATTIGSFRFFGEDYTTAYISTNGYVTFDFGTTSPGPPFPANPDYENAYIAALGDDLNPAAGGAVFYRGRDTDNDGSDDELVITYFRVPRFNFPSEFATFQVILRPGAVPGANGTVKLQYLVGSDPADGQPRSQGFNNPGSFNEDARVGITGDQGYASILYRDNGSGGVLFGGNSLALEFTPRAERVIGPDTASQRSGWRMLAPPTSQMTVADLSEQNLVQGIPGEYLVDANGNPGGTNIYTSYSGNTGFRRPSGLSEQLTAGKGFIWFFFNIDYDPEVDAGIFTGDSQSYPLPAPVVATGVTNTSNVTVPFTSAPDGDGVRAELLGNPFTAPLDISNIGAWTTGNLVSAIGQVWDPASRCYVPTSTLGDVLPVWQGAFFENDDATEITYPVVAIQQGAADPSARPTARRRVRFTLQGTASSNGEPTTDRAVVLEFSEAGTDRWDLRDATKLAPLSNTYATLSFGGERNGAPRLKAQESRAAVPAPFVVPLFVETARVAADLELTWALDDFPADWTFTLLDAMTGEEVDVRGVDTYSFQRLGARSEAAPVAAERQAATAVLPPSRAAALSRTSEARFYLSVVPPTPVTSAEADAGTPPDFALDAPYPNPFSSVAVLGYAVAEAARVQLAVYDALGRRVAQLVDDHVGPGRYDVTWQPADLPSGLYLVRFEAGAHRFVQKLTLVN